MILEILALVIMVHGATEQCLTQFTQQGNGLACHYLCDDPVCPPLCYPSCTSPVCVIQCAPGSSCHLTTPSCSIRCATDSVPSDSCPGCETICNPLPGACHGCDVLCEAPACGWKCRLPDDCPLPMCQLQCEHPTCESAVPCVGSVASSSIILILLILFTVL